MEPALKQRLIGGAVLVALAVIFLPMLIKGPAPESGAADVPLDMPAEPADGVRTVEIPLGPQSSAPATPAQAEPDALPTVDTTTTRTAPVTVTPVPSGAAAGDWAVSFASYATPADADRVIAALRGVQLRAWQEAVTGRTGRTVHRVRIGPFASEAEAEAARIRAGRVRSDIKAQVIALDAGVVPLADPRVATAAASSVSTPAPLGSGTQASVAALPATPPAARPAPTPAAPKPAPPATTTASTPAPAPASTPAAPAAPAPAPEPRAAAGTGFAVQVGAFSKAEDAARLRDRLRAAGFSAFIEDVRSDKGVLSRVRVGPVATREQAAALRAQVSGKVGVSGDVRPHP